MKRTIQIEIEDDEVAKVFYRILNSWHNAYPLHFNYTTINFEATNK